MSTHRTVAAPIRHEIDPILGSRFVADVVPVTDAEGAAAAIAAVQAQFPDASHHCWAYRLAPAGVAYRVSDAGEPRGSAGVPILKRIEGLDLVDVLVIVTRWFGGTKLGVGGLMRAYGGAAAAALAHAALIDVVPMARVEVRYPYTAEGRVKALLAAESHEPLDARYAADVRVAFEVPVTQVEEFVSKLADATSGAAVIRIEEG